MSWTWDGWLWMVVALGGCWTFITWWSRGRGN